MKRVEDGDTSLQVLTLSRVSAAVGLKIWVRAYPQSEPTLRDTGQLLVADWLLRQAHASMKAVLEHPLGELRSADLVLFGAEVILDIEIERILVDFQAQYRIAIEKRDLLAEAHQRPVRLILAVTDTRRNRAIVANHAAIRAALPAGSREILRAIRTGVPLARDGILWVRPGPAARRPGPALLD